MKTLNNGSVVPKIGDIPPIPKELIEYLEGVYRPTVDPEYDLRDYDIMVGEQRVIGLIKRIYETQKG